MSKVWTAAQCMDFFDDISATPPGPAIDNRDAFNDFLWYTTNEPRAGLTGLQCPIGPGPSGILVSPISQEELDVAFNDDPATGAANEGRFYYLPSENAWPSDTNPYLDDPVVTYLNLILPVGTPLPPGPAVTCAPPIPTGVCVDRVSMSPYADAVCPNPGCHYQPPGGGGSTCTTIGTCIP